MKAKAKSAQENPTWVEGKYITEPPIRPLDGLKRPIGHYIDKGGYPGANICEINADTLCMCTSISDHLENQIFENDILLYECADEIHYLIVYDTETAVNIITGEVSELSDLQTKNTKVIGNIIDFPDFVEGIRYYADSGLELPYIPALNVQRTSLPYMKVTCLKCGYATLSCMYMARHKECGGYFLIDFVTKIMKKIK